jgi:hypothetical protein
MFLGAAPRPTGAHFTPSKKAVLEHFVMVGDGKGSQFMHLVRTSLSKPDDTTAQAATLSSSNSALLPPIDHANGF